MENLFLYGGRSLPEDGLISQISSTSINRWFTLARLIEKLTFKLSPVVTLVEGCSTNTCWPQCVPWSSLGAVVNSISFWHGFSLLPRKWTSNHPLKPQSLVSSAVIEDVTLSVTLRMSSTVAVEQSISLMMAAVPITWSGWGCSKTMSVSSTFSVLQRKALLKHSYQHHNIF